MRKTYDPRTMTLQEIFDVSCSTIIGQGKLALYHDAELDVTIGKYVGPDGCQCAVGPFVPDTMLPDAEELSLQQVFRLKGQNLDEPRINLLCDLQWCHDGCSSRGDMGRWARHAMVVASIHGLSPVVLNAVLP